MFDGNNLAISGGQFVQAETVIRNVSKNQTDPFELLQRRVSPSAFHNSAHRFDPPRCHPDTRVATLERIFNWIVQSEHRRQWLLWLNGAAGAGKSATMQSTAERCVPAAVAIASFFFFRSDSTRNTMVPLVATLVYQLIQIIPETSDYIIQAIARNPLIFDQSLESQFQQLLIQPLLRLPIHLQRIFVILIDGLDECLDRAHQSNLINILGAISRARSCPVIFLVASGREPQIEAAFVDKRVYSHLLTLPLDNSDIEQTSDDIRRFLNDKFRDIKETHLRKHFLPVNWPSPSNIEEIVTKSSGQFIYASAVIHYISSPRALPSHQLDIIRGLRLRGPSSQNPFAHLDALYRHIFSQVEALDKVLDILAFILIIRGTSIGWLLEEVFLLEAGELEVYLADLTSVIECERGNAMRSANLKFLHGSLPDFLLDQSRSGRYYINIDQYATKLLCMLLERPPLGSVLGPLREFMRFEAIAALLRGVRPSARLHEAIMKFNFDPFPNSEILLDIMKLLKRLDFDDQGQAYYRALDIFAAGCANYKPSDRDGIVEKCPDLLDRISEICQRVRPPNS